MIWRRRMDYSTKNALYSGSGVREYGIVDPAKERTTVYRYEEDAAPTIFPFADEENSLTKNPERKAFRHPQIQNVTKSVTSSIKFLSSQALLFILFQKPLHIHSQNSCKNFQLIFKRSNSVYSPFRIFDISWYFLIAAKSISGSAK